MTAPDKATAARLADDPRRDALDDTSATMTAHDDWCADVIRFLRQHDAEMEQGRRESALTWLNERMATENHAQCCVCLACRILTELESVTIRTLAAQPDDAAAGNADRAWQIASMYSAVLASETRDLAAHITAALAAAEERGRLREREEIADFITKRAREWTNANRDIKHDDADVGVELLETADDIRARSAPQPVAPQSGTAEDGGR